MRRIPPLLAMAIISFVAMAGADSPSTQPESSTPATAPSTQPIDQTDRLIQQLSSDKWHDRESAEVALVELGDAAVPKLQALLKRDDLDVEVRTRAEAAIRKIDTNKRIGTSYITLHIHDAPLSAIVAEFSRQCGGGLDVDQANMGDQFKTRRATLDLDHVPFWDALQKLAEKTGLRPRPWGDDPRMVLDFNGGGQDFAGPTVTYGAFRIVAQAASRTRTIMFGHAGANNAQGQTNLQLVVLCEPKIHILNGQFYNWLRDCVDENGKSLLMGNGRSQGYANGRSWCWNLQAQLSDAPDIGHKIARLRGELKVNVETRSQTLEIPNILAAKNITKTIGDFTLTFEQITNTNDQYQAKLIVLSNSAARADQLEVISQSIQLVDGSGQPLQVAGRGETSNDGRLELTCTYGQYGRHGEKIGPPAKLIWEVPIETQTMSIPFEMTDLPLP